MTPTMAAWAAAVVTLAVVALMAKQHAMKSGMAMLVHNLLPKGISHKIM